MKALAAVLAVVLAGILFLALFSGDAVTACILCAVEHTLRCIRLS